MITDDARPAVKVLWPDQGKCKPQPIFDSLKIGRKPKPGSRSHADLIIDDPDPDGISLLHLEIICRGDACSLNTINERNITEIVNCKRNPDKYRLLKCPSKGTTLEHGDLIYLARGRAVIEYTTPSENGSVKFESFLNEHHVEKCNEIWLSNQPSPPGFQALSIKSAPIAEDDNMCFKIKGKVLRLRDDEARLLSLLIQRFGSSTVTYAEIIKHVWGDRDGASAGRGTADIHTLVKALRNTMKNQLGQEAKQLIGTHNGVGYYLEDI